jgi:tetratricopeptide (TPR) repeat protein
MDMPEDDLAEILKKHLVIEDRSLQALMFETLELCRTPGGTVQAINMLDAKRLQFSSGIDFLEKAPYCCLFLAYGYFKQENYSLSVQWARVAIDRLDQLDQVWNRSIARWICALIYRQSNRLDDAGIYFEAAIKLMKQEIQDLKRRSHYEKAEECEFALDQLLIDAGLT